MYANLYYNGLNDMRKQKNIELLVEIFLKIKKKYLQLNIFLTNKWSLRITSRLDSGLILVILLISIILSFLNI